MTGSFLDHIATRWLCIQGGQLIELPEPDEFYQSLLEAKTDESIQQTNSLAGSAGDSANKDTSNEGFGNENSGNKDLLQRIETLELKLEEDLKRKPKFQKPGLQKEWKAELEDLWSQVE